jgi:hypothetical protein
MDQFVNHFKNLISNDNVDNGPDTTDTMDCVFEELDKPFFYPALMILKLWNEEQRLRHECHNPV